MAKCKNAGRAVVCSFSQRPSWLARLLLAPGAWGFLCYRRSCLSIDYFLTARTFSLVRCHNMLRHDGKASATQCHGCTRQSIIILRACLNNNPPPLCHFRWQHPLVSWRNHCNYPPFPSISSLHFIANICHCPPLCCRSIPFGDLTGASTVPASCGDWWLRGSNVQVWLLLSRIT